MVRRVFLCLALCFAFVGVAFALVQPQKFWAYPNSQGQWVDFQYSSAVAACQAGLGSKGWAYESYSGNDVAGTCIGSGGGFPSGSSLMQVRSSAGLSCPPHSTAVTGGCQCQAGYDESGGLCVPHVNQCTSQIGQSSVISWTEGFTRTPDEGDTQAVGSVNVVPNSICSGGCNVSVQKVGPGVEYYVSQQPTSQGLYRRSRDMPGVNLGTECTAGPNDGNQPTAAEPVCPGTVGMVGNKPTCISTPEKPVTPVPLPTPDKPPIAGNPAAGVKPPSGEGSGQGSVGRTPSAGTGGNAGGGAAAGMGGRGGGSGTAAGTGTTGASNSGGRVANPGDGTEQAACGAPGQPVCAVKVDENSMPAVGDTFKGANDAVDKGKTDTDALRSKAAGSDDKGFFEPFRNLFITPPLAACEPITLPESVGSKTLDPCPVVDGTRSVMAYIWAFGGLIACLYMIKKAI